MCVSGLVHRKSALVLAHVLNYLCRW